MKRLLTIAILTAVMAALNSCASYAPQVNLPATVSSIAVPIFINKTNVYNMEQYVTEKTINNFIADGRVSITEEKKADAIVKCRITKYILTPIRFDVNQVAQQYRLRIYLDIYFFDNKAQRLLWKDEGEVWEETTYFVVNNIGMPAEDESIARNRVLDALSTRVVRRVIYGNL